VSGWRFQIAWPFLVVLLLVIMAGSLPARAADQVLRAFTIRNNDADAIAKVLTQVFGDRNLVLVADARTNTILARANQARLDQIQMIIAQLDGAGFVRRQQAIGQRGRAEPRRTRPALNVDIQVLADGSVEIRAPDDADYWVRGLVVREGTRVKENQALMLLDNSDLAAHELLLKETELLRRLLAKAEALSRQHRDRTTKSDRQLFAKAVKRSIAIRAGIAEKTRQLRQLNESESTYVVAAEIDGVVTYAQTIEEYCPDARALKPHQLLLRITPE
jgi:hypothetical protein